MRQLIVDYFRPWCNAESYYILQRRNAKSFTATQPWSSGCMTMAIANNSRPYTDRYPLWAPHLCSAVVPDLVRNDIINCISKKGSSSFPSAQIVVHSVWHQMPWSYDGSYSQGAAFHRVVFPKEFLQELANTMQNPGDAISQAQYAGNVFNLV